MTHLNRVGTVDTHRETLAEDTPDHNRVGTVDTQRNRDLQKLGSRQLERIAAELNAESVNQKSVSRRNRDDPRCMAGER